MCKEIFMTCFFEFLHISNPSGILITLKKKEENIDDYDINTRRHFLIFMVREIRYLQIIEEIYLSYKMYLLECCNSSTNLFIDEFGLELGT